MIHPWRSIRSSVPEAELKKYPQFGVFIRVPYRSEGGIPVSKVWIPMPGSEPAHCASRAAYLFPAPPGLSLAAMIIPNADPVATPLLIRAIAGAVAMAAGSEYVELDLSGIAESDPTRRKAAVAEHLRATMGELEAVIRSKASPPAQEPAPVLASCLVARGERFDSDAGTYAPGPGFETLLRALAADADADAGMRRS